MAAINKITNTPILINSYNSRGLICNKNTTRQCVRTPSGDLYALVGYHANYLNVLRSTDNGFTWNIALENVSSELNVRNVAALSQDGLQAFLFIDEQYRLIDIYYGIYDGVSDYDIIRERFDLDDLTASATTTNIWQTVFQGACYVTHNHEQFFVLTNDGAGSLEMLRASPRSTAVSAALTLGGTTSTFNHFSAAADAQGRVHVTFMDQEAGPNNVYYYVQYDSTTPSWGTPVQISDLGSGTIYAFDQAIAIDGDGKLCTIWGEQNGSAVTIKYSFSTDTGTTWSTPVSLTRTAGNGVFSDSITSDEVGRTDIIGSSQGGFMITYVEDNSASVPKTYVRRLLKSGSSSLILQEEKEIATVQAAATDSVVGLMFFHPTDTKLLDLDDSSQVRVAYTIGEGDSTTMNDTIPVSFHQELLSESAYPTLLASDVGTYTIEAADAFSVLTSLAILPGPNAILDYFDIGMVGDYTTRYDAAFDRVGTFARFLKFEPKDGDYMNDRSSYTSPVESSERVIFDPQSYAFPTPELIPTNQTSYIEQDVRKIYMPPNKFLSRTFLVNKGGYLKRTVWLLEHDGNQYEISQVVPRFIDNQICYYEANAYVVGPSRDPFSRTVLPSET